MVTCKCIAHFRSPFTSKFGIPRQSGVVADVKGEIVLEKEYSSPDAVRGIESFDYLWLIWQFSANDEGTSLLVRPPRLGGNEKVGVFASRSPFRPNRLGLSCVRLEGVRQTNEGIIIDVLGADLMDGTPIIDIKPYVAYCDSHPDARSGFVDQKEWHKLEVRFPNDLKQHFTQSQQDTLLATLAQDPRPQYHNDPDRIYGMPFAGKDVKFRVSGNRLEVIDVNLKY